MHQRNIHHGHLVDNHNVRLKRILLIPLKPCRTVHTAVQFQHAVYGSRLKPGRLAHALRRTSGRRCKKDICSFFLKEMDHCIDRRCFSGTRSSGDNQKSVAHRLFDRCHLVLIQFHSGLLLNSANTLLDFQIRNIIADIELF